MRATGEGKEVELDLLLLCQFDGRLGKVMARGRLLSCAVNKPVVKQIPHRIALLFCLQERVHPLLVPLEFVNIVVFIIILAGAISG